MPSEKIGPHLNTIMIRIYDITMAYAYTRVERNQQLTREYLQDVVNILTEVGIPLPDIGQVRTIDKPEVANGWGEFIDGRTLSIILERGHAQI